MDPTRPGDQAEALAATRRILARLKLEILGDEDAPPGVFTGEDRELLEGDTAERRRDDLRVFVTWHAALGTDPDAARPRRAARENLRTGDGEAGRRVRRDAAPRRAANPFPGTSARARTPTRPFPRR